MMFTHFAQIQKKCRVGVTMSVAACFGLIAPTAYGQYSVDADAAEVTAFESTAMASVTDENEPEAGVSQVGFLGQMSASSYCDSGCDACGETTCCCKPWWAHRHGAFGQFLLLRPGNTDQIFELEFNDPAPDAPTGPVGRLNIDEEAGFRTGFSLAASDCTSLVASYTFFESNTSSSLTAAPGNVLVSQVIHPDLGTVGGAGLSSSGSMGIDFQMVDLAYRHLWKQCDTYAINWLAGFRYGHMEQDLTATQERAIATGNVTVDTDVDFDGFGMLLGLDAQRRSPGSGLMIYGRGVTSFLAGDWRGDYSATNQFGGGVVANDYEDYRVTPVAELELGFGWQSKCGRCSATVGYMTSAWYDAVSSRQYINSVRNDSYVDVDETITFSGLTAGVEARF